MKEKIGEQAKHTGSVGDAGALRKADGEIWKDVLKMFAQKQTQR